MKSTNKNETLSPSEALMESFEEDHSKTRAWFKT